MPPPDSSAVPSWIDTLLRVSLTGLILYRPLLDAAGRIVDFAFVRLNEAAQQRLDLPAQPAQTYLTQYPHAAVEGVLAFYCAAYTTGGLHHFEADYPHDDLHAYFRLAAQRHDDLLVVSFTDARHRDGTPVETALREKRLQEQAARVAAEAQYAQLQRVLDQAPALLCILAGPDLVVEFTNGAYQLLLGSRPLRGRPLAEAVPELAGQGFLELLRAVYRTGELYQATAYPATLDFACTGQAETRYFTFSYQARRDAAGTIDGVIVLGYDVSEQVSAGQQVDDLNHRLRHANESLELQVQARTRELEQARAEAEAQRARLESLFRAAPAIVNTNLGPDHVFELVHPLTERLFGFRPLVGLPIRQAMSDVRGPFFDLMDEVYRTGQPFTGHAMRVDFTPSEAGPPSEAYYDLTYQPLFGTAGQVEGVMTFAVDVTAQVRARQQAEAWQAELVAAAERRGEERQALYRIFEQVPVGIALLREPDHRLEYLNPTFVHLFPGENLLGRTIVEAYPDSAARGVVDRLDRVFQTGEAYVGTEVPLPANFMGDQPAPPRYINFTYQAYREQGRIVGVTATVYEVTEQVQARQQLEASRRQAQRLAAALRRSNDDLDTFVYTASHDLKAPITNIEGLLQVVQEETATGKWTSTAGHALTLMQDAVERFRTTLGHLSEVTRLQPATEPIAPVAVEQIVADVQLDLAPLIAAARALVVVEVSACGTVYAPAKTLRSVVYNLLSNALKYRAPERAPEVRIHCREEAQQVVLEVQDNGLGLDMTHQTELFGMFRRYHTHVEGAGVGLYMVKRMVEHAGGRIDVRSQPGEGSVFTVHFPFPTEAGEPATATS